MDDFSFPLKGTKNQTQKGNLTCLEQGEQKTGTSITVQRDKLATVITGHARSNKQAGEERRIKTTVKYE